MLSIAGSVPSFYFAPETRGPYDLALISFAFHAKS